MEDPMQANKPPGLTEIRQAAERIRPFIHRTPVMTCDAINKICDSTLYFKCENFQKGGAFKIRGACNTIFSLSREVVSAGVATHSSGNHAAAVALASRWRGVKAFVVMPEDAPAVKKAAVASYGADIIFCPPTLEARESYLERTIRETGAALIHPYNDHRIIAGQGTAALELCEEISDLDMLVAPVGGGGLISGTALAAASLFPGIETIAAEPSGADDACRSFRAGKMIPMQNPDTIADGLRTSLGDLTFPIIQKYVKDIVAVDEDLIVKAMHLVWERMKIIIEPSAAVPLAALLAKKIDASDKKIGILLSGGNVDLAKLPWLNKA